MDCTYGLAYVNNAAFSATGLEIEYTKSTRFTLPYPIPGEQYKFCVFLINECGDGPHSPCLNVETSSCVAPSAPTLLVSDTGCEIRLDWFSGQHEDCPAERFKLEIADQDGEFRPLNGCGHDPSIRSCILAMDVLASSPFHLSRGMKIAARASAWNEAGWGETSILTRAENNLVM
jgi:hypothetical protein